MRLPLLAATGVCLALASCAPPTADNDDATTITVSAAASLTDAFTEIGAAFTEANPGIEVRFNFAGSSSLAEQINAGAPVDVFAAASSLSMDRARDALAEPTLFASNSLAIAVPPGNPAAVTTLADLQDPNVTLLVCAAQVPCGSATEALLERNGLEVTPSSLEPDVRAVLTKVIADEADAGIVYRTDTAAAGDQVEQIAIPDDSNVINRYPIAATQTAPPAADAFVDFVLSASGQRILASWGFGAP